MELLDQRPCAKDQKTALGHFSKWTGVEVMQKWYNNLELKMYSYWGIALQSSSKSGGGGWWEGGVIKINKVNYTFRIVLNRTLVNICNVSWDKIFCTISPLDWDKTFLL